MRYLKITLSGAALFLIYLWVTIMLNSCNNAKPTIDKSIDDVEMLEEEMDGTDFTESEFEGDEDGGINYNSDSDDSKVKAADDADDEVEENDEYVAGDYTASPEKTKLKPRKKPAPKTKTFTPSSSSSPSSKNSSVGNTSGEYLVIAGSYLLEENAKKMIRKLQGMGYSNAEIIYFNQSQYHSICAGRYSSNGSAKKTASSLQSNGIDSYVHRKQN